MMLISSLAIAGDKPTVIRLHNTASVKGQKILLSEISQISSANTALVKTLSDIVIVDDFSRDDRLIISRDVVLEKVSENLKSIFAEKPIMAGSSSVKVRRKASLDSGISIIEFAEKKIRTWLSEKYPRFEVEQVGEIVVPAFDFQSASINVLDIKSKNAEKRMVVWVELNDRDNHKIKSVPVWFSVKAFEKVYVSTRNIGLRKDLFVDDLEVQERDITHLRDMPVVYGKKIVGMQLRKPLQQGGILTYSALEKIPAVRFKQRVRVILEAQG